MAAMASKLPEVTKYPLMAPPKLKKLIGPLTVLTYLVSIPALAVGVWLLYIREDDCEHLLRMPRMRVWIGVALIVLFVVSNALAFYGRKLAMPGMLALMAPLVAMLLLGLALVGAYKMESRAVPASPVWLQRRVSQSAIWNDIKTCVFDSKVCSDLAFRTIELTSYDFSMIKLSPIESGCCKPPDLCGMRYVNATYWIPASKGGGKSDDRAAKYASFRDCKDWSNECKELCYDCIACKLGFVEAVHRRWGQLGVFLILMAVFFSLAHAARLAVTYQHHV